MEPKDLSPSAQELAIGLYPEQAKSSLPHQYLSPEGPS
jgi:hypothetical protein